MKFKNIIKRIIQIQKNSSDVLGINNRNLGYVYPNNKRVHFPMANDKLLCKEILTSVGVSVPDTKFSYGYFYELRNLDQDLEDLNDFVIKPANGSGGNGIIVITDRVEGKWISAGGRAYDLEDIKKHISDIIFGAFSHDMMDHAIIEERIIQHEMINSICDLGLSDIRVILYKDQPISAMARIPTSSSDGKANLHQGAIALGIDIETGISIHAIKDGESITTHPDSQKKVIGLLMPYWDEAISMAVKAAESVPLKYLGVDIAITNTGVTMIEINARPGIEIQNANDRPMREQLEYANYLESTKGLEHRI